MRIDSSGAITTDVTGEVTTPLYVDGYRTGVQQIWLNNSRAANSSNGRGTKLVLGAGNTIGAYFTHYTSGSTGNGVLDIGVQYTGVTTQSGLEFNTNSNRTIIKSVGSSAAYTAFESSDGTERMRIDSSGNVGIGVIPNAPANGLIQLDVGDNGCGMTSRQNNELVLQANANYSTYAQAGKPATRLNLTNTGEFHFLNAPAGTAIGDTISFTERMRINSSGNVGIGTDSPNAKLHSSVGASGASVWLPSNTPMVLESSGTNALNFLSPNTGEAYIMFSRPTNTTAGYMSYAHATDTFGLNRPIALSGAYLGGTAAGNLLDDYEEGTWTPNVTSTSVSAYNVPPNGIGRYTKIGRQVIVSFEITGITATSGNQHFVFNGLPFTQHTASHDEQGYCSNYPKGNRGSGIIINNSSGEQNTWFMAYNNSSAQSSNAVQGTIIYTT